MFTWKQDNDGWVANGYRIELVKPGHWVLLKDEPATAAVRIEPIPLAETHTLTLCKREAELMDTASRVAEARRRSWGKLVLAVLAFALVPTLAPPWNLVLTITLLTAAARTVGFLLGTYMARSHVKAGELFYQ